MSAQVEDRAGADGRRVEAVRGADHRTDERANRIQRVGLVPERVEHAKRLAAQLQRLLHHPRRVADPAPAQPPFEVVDVGARQPGEGRAQEAVQIVPTAGEPVEAQEREQRLAERRLADPEPALDRVRHVERRQCGLELCALAFDARADEKDLLGLRAGSDQLQHLVRDELERAAGSRSFEEADRPLELERSRGPVGEEVTLEMGELRRRDLRVARRELLDAPGSEGAQVLGRACQRLERRPVRLVRQGDGDVGAAGERFEERPLRARQVLEAVGEDGPVRPRVELAGDEIGGVSPAQVPVPEPEFLELGAIRRVETREVAAQLVGLDETRLELRERGAQRIRET